MNPFQVTPDPTLIAALACIALSTAMLVYLVMINRPEAVAGREGRKVVPIDNPVMRIALPTARALAPIHRGAELTPSGREVDRKIGRAGRPWGMTVAEFLCLRYVALVAGGAFGYLVSIGFYGTGQPLWGALGAVLFFTMPNSRLTQAVERRRIAIFRDLPNVLDILVLSTEAGQDFSSAMGTLVEKGPPGPLVEEFRVTMQEVMLGKSRADALRGMADRVDLPELTSFILALVQA
ncbi:MAG: type II secretion system F family protein, partial [Candidatus Binatia bacterium]